MEGGIAVATGKSYKADHPSAIMFSVFSCVQRVVLVPTIFLAERKKNLSTMYR